MFLQKNTDKIKVKKVFLQITFAGLAVLLAVVFYIHTLHLPKAAYQLPRILIVIVILLSIAMVVERLYSHKKNLRQDSKNTDFPINHNPGVSKEDEFDIRLTRVFVFIVLITGYILTIERLGYFIITPIFIIATYLYLRAAKFLNIILIAVGFTFFVYLLFVLFLHLPIPMGILS